MNQAIGVFDSGVGGLTVVRELRQRFPMKHIHYLGDTARVPYGTKSARTVERYALTCQNFLLERQVKLVMVACNTASANALPALQASTSVPVIGAVHPGALAALAASRSRHIAVLGTLGTVRSGAYEEAIGQRDPSATVVARACPLFVPLAEEGWGDTDIALLAARRYLSELFENNDLIDTIVLGCTHYPLLRDVVSKVCAELSSKPVQIIDSAAAMVTQAAAHLEASAQTDGDARRGALQCFVTDESRMEELAPRFLGETLDSLETVDL
ncbi:MAG: glutamate racemase [Myxococcales bacterium]|nr:glutamate racemase [Myxococcales bacterium]